MVRAVGLEGLPPFLTLDSVSPCGDPGEAGAAAERLTLLHISTNRRVEVARSQYLHLVRQAAECVERLNTRIALGRDLPAQMQLRPVREDSHLQILAERLPLLEPLPTDFAASIEAHCRLLHFPPFSLWQRLRRLVR